MQTFVRHARVRPVVEGLDVVKRARCAAKS
jgi:hypothetical protein